MELKSKHYFEGRKVRKTMEKRARQEAKSLITGDLGQGTRDLDDARSIMETYFWMKPKHIDSIIIKKQLIGGWVVLLTFKDLPPGIPNVLGAPVKPTNEVEAKFEAERLLRAVYVKCEDTKELMRSGEMDDLRTFRYQEIFLQVPGEMVDAVAKKTKPVEDEKVNQKLRQQQIDLIHGILGQHTADVATWNSLDEDQQLKVMIAAAHLLCLNINLVA